MTVTQNPDELKKFLKKFYSDSDAYHKLIGHEEETGYTYDHIVTSLIKRRSEGNKRVKFLDVACGTGHYVGLARKEDAFACGVDLSPHACAGAKGKDPSLNIERADAEHMPFANGVFDIAICLQMIEHTPYPERVIGEICRVLKPGGLLFISAPNILGSNAATRSYRIIKNIVSGGVKELRPLQADILEKWQSAASVTSVADIDACNKTNIFQVLKMLKHNGMEIEHKDTLRHPRKYSSFKLFKARLGQRIPLIRYYGINFKIIARKR